MTTASPWLVKAVDDNDADAIQSMFKVGVDLKTIHPETNNSLLIHAIQNKKGKAALKLIECGAEVNDRHNFSQDTALILAARNGMKNVCEALLKKGVQVDSENLEDETALLVAMNAKIALLLIENGANINATDWRGNTPLSRSYLLGSDELCLKLLAKGAYTGTTQDLLYKMAELGFSQCCLKAIKDGAKLEWLHAGEQNALHIAASYGKTHTCKMLLENGAKIDALDNWGRTALIIAAENHPETANFLIDQHANIHITDQDGDNPLLVAALYEHQDLCMRLLNLGVNPHHKNAAGESALTNATFSGLEKLCMRLIGENVDLDARDRELQTPLINAITNKMPNVALELIKLGADINLSDAQETTALMVAAKKRDHKTFSALLKAGANMKTLDHQGDSAMFWCCLAISDIFARKMLHYGHKPTEVELQSGPSRGKTPFDLKDIMARMQKRSLAAFPNDTVPTRNKCFSGTKFTGALLDSCALGRFGDAIATPLIASGTQENLNLYKEIWDKLPECWRKQHRETYMDYTKARGNIQPAQGLDDDLGRMKP